MIQATSLDALFFALGGRSAYQWQQAAFERLRQGRIPGQIKVPTSAGKTMMLAIWLAALAEQAEAGQVTLPRRLVHTVNRRILVDEATRLAAQIQHLLDADPALARFRAALVKLSATGTPLAVSALRGGIDDDGAWAADPSTPAIVLATPDMLGSRLLFRGYGLGRSRAATHAGLLGCDTLVVHDEAHLAPAFTRLLRQVEASAKHGALEVGCPALSVIEMTATLAGDAGADPLECRIAEDRALVARMSAVKRLQLVDARLAPSKASKPGAMVLDSIAVSALAEQSQNRAVAVFVSTPAAADVVAARLVKGGVDATRIALLTGTMRGHERNQLALSPAFARFSPGADRREDSTAYFIATSAGEIGLDIDADIGLFDLSTLDRFIQRAGRVNRRGIGVGRIALFYAGGEEAPGVLVERTQRTLAILESLPTVEGSADASPHALSALCDRADYTEAAAPVPATRALEPGIVQMLSMTSMRLDQLGCPGPDVFIHGVVDDIEQVTLAWRRFPENGADAESWLEAWPLQPAEAAALPIDPARRLLKERLHAARARLPGVLAIALDGQGLPTSSVAASDNIDRWVNRLQPGALVLLDQRAGGLNPQGLPAPEADQPVPDVSVGAVDGAPALLLSLTVSCAVSDDDVVWTSAERAAGTLEALLTAMVPPGYDLAFHDGPRQLGGLSWSGTVTLWLRCRVEPSPDLGDAASITARSRLLTEHLDLTGLAARRLCEHLPLAPSMAASQVHAAVQHDAGKAWARWQLAIGNRAQQPLGKSGHGRFDFKLNDGYRHELGSVVDQGNALSLLERHLVASHHGWCRPQFNDNARSKPGCAVAADDAALGFASLSAQLGPWALAYLEALLKTADVHAELHDVALAKTPPLVLDLARDWTAARVPDAAEFRIRVDTGNFGEYLAALGLAALCEASGRALLLGWEGGDFVIRGMNADAVTGVLRRATSAAVEADIQATTAATAEAAYPPLLLRLTDGGVIHLNHWLDARLLAGSRWKLGAGQTTAGKTLASNVQSCAALLARPGFDPLTLFEQGGGMVGADASKFRFDAATNWSARDAGFSLNESDAFKSTRPWVELLSALGLQRFFLPPADKVAGYFIWRGWLPPMLALAAAKGLLPESHSGLRPVINPNGKMKDVFTSKPIVREERSTCPTSVLVI